MASALFAPWGVQLAGSFSKAAALAAYTRARSSYSAIIGKIAPMVIGGRVPSRGFAPNYQVRALRPRVRQLTQFVKRSFVQVALVSSCEVEAALESLIETGLGRAETGWPIITAKRRPPHHVASGTNQGQRPCQRYVDCSFNY